ncbi:MAG TPA: transferrin receptor-like dimerization domain-containing protein, partial [Pyrinomonadaceae bacterium]
TEPAMISQAGLPRRPWFKHQIYAPGFYTGYGVKTLPAIREAIEQRNWTEAEEQIILVAGTINRIAAAIDDATAQMK